MAVVCVGVAGTSRESSRAMDLWWITALAALAIGALLGLFGGGGGVLLVPMLVGVAGMDQQRAIATSLAAVAVGAAVATARHARAGNVAWRVGFVVAAAGAPGALVGARVAQELPAPVLVALLATVMLASAAGMWRGPVALRTERRSPALGLLLALGAAVGLLTGLVGTGGGFVVVPALVLVGGLALPRAVGTSLLVVTINAGAGWLGHANAATMDPALTALVTACVVVGSVGAVAAGARAQQRSLQRAFALLVAVVAVAMVARSVWPA